MLMVSPTWCGGSEEEGKRGVGGFGGEGGVRRYQQVGMGENEEGEWVSVYVCVCVCVDMEVRRVGCREIEVEIDKRLYGRKQICRI